MKKILLLLLLPSFIISCNDRKTEKVQPETEVSENVPAKTYEGEFIYTADAAVFKGNSFVYGVQMNDVANDLAQRVAAIKEGDYDMVPVIVRGKVTPKPEGAEGWDEIIIITEIINVSDTPRKADLELKANKD